MRGLWSLREVSLKGLIRDGDWVESKDQDPTGAFRLTQLADIGVGEFRNRSNRWMRLDQVDALNCTRLQSGDILIARMPDPIGRACLVPSDLGNAVTAVDVSILRIRRQDIEPRYVMWMINSPQFQREVIVRQSGTTRKRIARKRLELLSIPSRSIAEQHRIVEIIDGHLSRLDAAVQDLDSAEAKLNALVDSLVMAALTGGNAARDAESVQLPDVGTQDGELAALPAGWTWARLGEVADVRGGVTKDSKKQSDPTFVDVPYLRVANVQRAQLDLDNVTTIRVSPEKAGTLRLLPGDVLLNEGGDRDKLARGWVWESQIEHCIHQNHVFRARPSEGINPYFLSWVANTIGGKWAERNGRQSVNLASISLTTIKKMPVIVPPVEVANVVVNKLHEQLTDLERAKVQIESARSRQETLRSAVLAAAFDGRLTGHGVDEEIIEEMAENELESRES